MTFTAVEPSAQMLAVCRTRAETGGFADRCTFHNGYLDTLPAALPTTEPPASSSPSSSSPTPSDVVLRGHR